MHGSTFAYPSVGPVQIANGTGVCGGRLRSVHTGQRRLVVARGLGEDFQKFMDSLAFEKWAPRSSQAWRLGKTPRSVRKGTAGATEQDELLTNLAEGIEASRSGDAGSVDDDVVPEKATLPDENVFTKSTDGDLSSSLNERIAQIASASGEFDDDTPESEPAMGMTGEELRGLIFEKYGKYYDAEFAIRKFMGKDLVSLNIMWVHSQQRSFPMTESSFADKLEGIAMLLNAWDKAKKVRAFLKAPRKSASGLPSRPIVGCAVSIKLDLDEATINEWFKNR